jgi:hypothetical protein
MAQQDPDRHPGSLDSVTQGETSPTVVEVLRFEDLPLGSRGSRRAVVRWSDGTEGEALSWYADEVLVCEGDHGNSRLMSSRAEPHSVAGSFRAWRGP